MKWFITSGLFAFWAISVSLLTASFIANENQKVINAFNGNNAGVARLNGQAGSLFASSGGVINLDGSANALAAFRVVGEDGEATPPNGGVYMTIETVAEHNTESDCWIIVRGNIYDVASYMIEHPAGAETIIPYCGGEATSAFETKDKYNPTDHSSYAYGLLDAYYIGAIGVVQVYSGAGESPSNNISSPGFSPSPIVKQAVEKKVQDATVTNTISSDLFPNTQTASVQQTLTSETISAHNTSSDCWMIVGNKVYDISTYLSQHPAGAGTIIPYCGKDGTAAFQSKGKSNPKDHSGGAYNILDAYYIGDVGGSTTKGSFSGDTTSGGTAGVSRPSNDGYSEGGSTVFSAIDQRFPGAVITKTKYEDDGRVKVEFIYNGVKYKAKLNPSGSIKEVESKDDD